MTEFQLKNKCIRWLKTQKLWWYHPSDRFQSGIPDLIVCKEGKFYAIELKIGKNKLTKLQNYVLERIRQNGGQVAVCSSLWGLKEVLNDRT